MHKRITINKDSNNLLYISTSRIEDDFVTSLHSHPNLEIILITEGNGFIQTTNKKLPVKQNNIVIINPNTKHCEIGDGLRFYAIGVRNTEVFLKDTYTKKIIINELSTYDYAEILSLYNMLYDEAQHMTNESDIIVNSCYTILFTIIKRSYHIIDNNDYNDNSDLVSNIKQIIDKYYYSSDLTLDELSHRLTMSKSTLCHTFKKETGMTIIDYKINKELEEACNLLKISDIKISDIALQVGFNNMAYFTKLFKQHYKKTPSSYREESRS